MGFPQSKRRNRRCWWKARRCPTPTSSRSSLPILPSASTLQQQVLSPSRLRPVIQSLNLVKPDEEGKLIEDIQQNMRVEPVITSMSAASPSWLRCHAVGHRPVQAVRSVRPL
jgi:hypothetical protein